jgi:hypothetical protein
MLRALKLTIVNAYTSDDIRINHTSRTGKSSVAVLSVCFFFGIHLVSQMKLSAITNS